VRTCSCTSPRSLGDGGTRLLREGQAVEFEVGEGDRGPAGPRRPVTGELAPRRGRASSGTVTWYEPGKGYGFAVPDGGGPEIFVHSSAIVTGGVVTAGPAGGLPGRRGRARAAGRAPAARWVPRARSPLQTTTAPTGTVSWYDQGKGFGFVTPGLRRRRTSSSTSGRWPTGLTWLTEGDRVTYEVVQGDKGPQARDLHLVHGADAARPPAAAAGAATSRSSGAAARPGEGVVARYDAERGFGFITPDAGGPDLFVHMSVLVDAAPLQKGERVRYGIRQSDRGPQADRVERA
jgi:CspA family cold shock protein